MAIRVKHEAGGGDISALVRLAAAAGLTQAQAPEAPGIVQLPSGAGATGFSGGGGGRSMFASIDKAKELSAQRDIAMREIDARADREKESADNAMKRVAVRAGLQGELQEQEYDRRVLELQEKAKVDASQFKFEINAKDRHELAKLNNAESEVRKLVADGEWNQEEGVQALQLIERKRMGIGPTAYPADLDKPPPFQDQILIHPETGAVIAPARSASVLVQPDKRPEYLQQKAESDRQAKLQDSRISALTKLSAVILSEETKDLATGKTTKKDRTLTKPEIDERMNMIFGVQEERGQRHVETAVSDLPSGEESEWWSALEGAVSEDFPKGIRVPEEFRNLPAEEGAAKALYEAYSQKFGSFENVPDELKPAYAEIIKAVRKHRGR